MESNLDPCVRRQCSLPRATAPSIRGIGRLRFLWPKSPRAKTVKGNHLILSANGRRWLILPLIQSQSRNTAPAVKANS